jgi:hypothetical protein
MRDGGCDFASIVRIYCEGPSASQASEGSGIHGPNPKVEPVTTIIAVARQAWQTFPNPLSFLIRQMLRAGRSHSVWRADIGMMNAGLVTGEDRRQTENTAARSLP